MPLFGMLAWPDPLLVYTFRILYHAKWENDKLKYETVNKLNPEDGTGERLKIYLACNPGQQVETIKSTGHSNILISYYTQKDKKPETAKKVLEKAVYGE